VPVPSHRPVACGDGAAHLPRGWDLQKDSPRDDEWPQCVQGDGRSESGLATVHGLRGATTVDVGMVKKS
jgi:hypothetical protein